MRRAMRRPRRVDLERFAVDLEDTGIGGQLGRDHLFELGLAVAVDARHADDLAGAHGEVDASQPSASMPVRRRRAGVAAVVGAPVLERTERVGPDHEAREPGAGLALDRDAREHGPSAPQDRDAVRAAEDLTEAMGDEHDAAALV